MNTRAEIANDSADRSGFGYSRRFLLGVLWPLIFLAFFGSLALAAHLLPTPYDWRYRVISNLLSPRDNPRWFWIPSSGISVAGLLMLPFVALVREYLASIHRAGARLVGRLFHFGIFALILSAVVVPQHARPFLGSTRWHEYFADLSAIGFATGMMGACYLAGKLHVPSSKHAIPRVLLLWFWRVLAFVPISGVIVCEALLEFARADFAASKAVKECLRHSIFWHLGFWEWTASAAVFLFWGVSAWLLPSAPREAKIGRIGQIRSI